MKKYLAYWNRVSITRKLITYFLIISFFGAVVNLFLHQNNYKAMDQFEQNLNNFYTINQLIVATRDNHTAIDDFMKSLNKDAEIKYYETKEQINELIPVLENQYTSVEVGFALNAIKYSVETYFVKWDRAIVLRKQNQAKYYVDYYEGVSVYEYTEQYVQKLLVDGLDEGLKLYQDLVKRSDSLQSASLIIIFATFILSLFFGGVFSKYLVAPIRKLVDSSIRISRGQLDVEDMEVNSLDEVGILADSFNKMSASIRTLVDDLKQKVIIEKKLHEEEIEMIKMQQLLQEAEFLALQAQINPHFLFNTLNTISRTAMFEGANETTKLIGALSSIFRFSLRSTGKSIKLSEEIEIVKEYMVLQGFRFKERVQFIIQCDVNLEKVQIPVFLIQPIVENSIIHGIEPKVKGGIVRIKIYEDDQYIHIRILDTGVGMSTEQLEFISHSLNNKNSNRIGLKNVLDRFHIFYENKGAIKIRSKLNCGTLVVLAIPKNREGLTSMEQYNHFS